VISAHQLAPHYGRYAAVLHAHYGTRRWRAELVGVRAFMVWVESFWWDEAPPEPASPPDAVSSDGERSVVRWYDAGPTVLGYPTAGVGVTGCYRVPTADAPPPLGGAPAPGRADPGRRPR
jgi:hypothetical protein